MVEDNNFFEKSTRHSLIIGNLGERLVCNWLSRKKFEVAIVDHTGIDLIAQNPVSKERLGITVKSRARNNNKENDSVNVFNIKRNDWGKNEAACSAFGYNPWLAIYLETKNYADLFLTSLSNYREKYCNNDAQSHYIWKMTKKWFDAYNNDENVKHLHFIFQEVDWF